MIGYAPRGEVTSVGLTLARDGESVREDVRDVVPGTNFENNSRTRCFFGGGEDMAMRDGSEAKRRRYLTVHSLLVRLLGSFQ